MNQALKLQHKERKQQRSHLGLSKHMAGNTKARNSAARSPLSEEEASVPVWKLGGQAGELASENTPGIRKEKLWVRNWFSYSLRDGFG